MIEIGCGNGVAAERVCSLLTGHGSYMGVDPSKPAIDAAFKRCAAYGKTQKAVFWNKAFDAADREPALFDRILAVNVNAFWTGEGAEFVDVRRLMHRKSVFALVYEPPSTEQRKKIAAILKERAASLFPNAEFSQRMRDGKPLLALVARL